MQEGARSNENTRQSIGAQAKIGSHDNAVKMTTYIRQVVNEQAKTSGLFGFKKTCIIGDKLAQPSTFLKSYFLIAVISLDLYTIISLSVLHDFMFIGII